MRDLIIDFISLIAVSVFTATFCMWAAYFAGV